MIPMLPLLPAGLPDLQTAGTEAGFQEWAAGTRDDIDRAVLDPGSFFASDDFSFTTEPVTAQRRVVIDGFLQLHNRGNPVGGGLSRDLARDTVARALFGNRGTGDDAAFYGEIEKGVKKQKAKEELLKSLADHAVLSQLVQATNANGTDTMAWEPWRQEAHESPGYDAADEPFYYETRNKIRGEVRDDIAPFQDQLGPVWRAMQAGGGGPEAMRAYSGTPAEDRPRLMAYLRLLATSLPAEQQPAFWSNLQKQTGRETGALGRGLARTVNDGVQVQNIERAAAARSPLLSFLYSDEARQKLDAQVEASVERDLAMNFASDVIRIQEQDYDPIKTVLGEHMPAWVERGIYSIPAAFGTSLVSATPGGTMVMFAAMQGAAHDTVRTMLIDQGVPEARANQLAREWSPGIGLAQSALEHLGAKALLGKLPIFDGTLTRLGNQITSKGLRFGARGLIISGQETGIETAQDFMPHLAQALGSALQKDVPGVKLHGPGGVFDGFWSRTGSTFVAVLPLALVGAAAGFSVEQRTKVFSQASDLELRAYLGVGEAKIAELRAEMAKGPSSAAQAIARALDQANPLSAEAQAAARELQVQADAKQTAVEEARLAGVVPRFHQSTEGWTVYDGKSGSELGKAADPAGALRLAAAHTAAVDESRANHYAYLASTLEAADAIRNTTDTPARQSRNILRPGETVTVEQQAALSSRDEAQVFEEVRLREQLEGVGFADIVLGQNVTEFKQGVSKITNTLNAGGTVRTVVHEYGHGFLIDALSTGRMSLAEVTEAIRAFDTVLKGKRERRGRARQGDPQAPGQQLNFLPGGEVNFTAVSEAVSEFLESEILRGGKTAGRLGLSPAIISRNITAASKLAPGAVSKFARFMSTVRELFGLAFQRAHATQKAIRDGQISEAQIDGFVAKLIGLDAVGRNGAAAASQETSGIAADPLLAFSLGRSATPLQMPDAVIAHPLGVVSGHPDYAAAKGGDPDAATRLAEDLVTPQMVEAVRAMIGDRKPIILPVLAIEQAGRNQIPQAVGRKLAKELGLERTARIVQAVRANRGGATGLDRVFISSNFKGYVIPGAEYLAVDDTLTQGGTFAGIADHLRQHGATLVGEVALTGKQYSRTLTLSHETLRSVRQRLGDLEPAFRDATGHGFDALTESEGRTLATWKPLDAVRARILAERDARDRGEDESSLGHAPGRGQHHLERVPGTPDQGRGEGHEVDATRDGSPAGADPGSAGDHGPRPGEPAEDGIRDPGRILESLVAGEARTHERADAGKRRKSKPGRRILDDTGLLAWAGRNGRIFPARAFAEVVRGGNLAHGGEHVVYSLPQGDRVLKLTKPGLFGAQGEDAGAYLRRWAFHNRAFGDDTTFEGFVTLEGEDLPRAVISQRFAAGRDATAEELAGYLVEKGFHEMPDGKWIHPVRGYELWDTITPGNAIMTDQGVRVIDLQLGPADPVALEELRSRSGIGRRSSFSLGPAKMAESLSGDAAAEMRDGDSSESNESDGDRATDRVFREPELWLSNGEPIAVPDELYRNLVRDIEDPHAPNESADWDPYDDLSDKAKAIILAEESKIAGMAREHLRLIDADGLITWTGIGTRDSISLPKGEGKGKTLVHNHPEGTPPSWEDLIEGSKEGLKELIVATPAYRFAVRFPGDRRGGLILARTYFKDVGDAVSREFLRKGEASESYELYGKVQHAILLELDRRGLIKYKRTRR